MGDWNINFTNILRTVFFRQKFCAQLFFVFKLLVCLFWLKIIGAKAAFKVLAKLTPEVNFTNILWAHLHQDSCAKNSSYLNFKHKKASFKTFIRKSCSNKVDETGTWLQWKNMSNVNKIRRSFCRHWFFAIRHSSCRPFTKNFIRERTKRRKKQWRTWNFTLRRNNTCDQMKTWRNEGKAISTKKFSDLHWVIVVCCNRAMIYFDPIFLNRMTMKFFLNIFFLVWLAPFGCRYYFRYFSAIKWSILSI